MLVPDLLVLGVAMVAVDQEFSRSLLDVWEPRSQLRLAP
jgi:hypothetical protein